MISVFNKQLIIWLTIKYNKAFYIMVFLRNMYVLSYTSHQFVIINGNINDTSINIWKVSCGNRNYLLFSNPISSFFVSFISHGTLNLLHLNYVKSNRRCKVEKKSKFKILINVIKIINDGSKISIPKYSDENLMSSEIYWITLA